MALLGLTSLALGIGSPAAGAGTSVSAAQNALAAGLDVSAIRSAPLNLRLVHPAVPRGYGTVEARAAQAAAETAAAAEAEAAQAAAARVAAASARAAQPASGRTPSSSTAGRPPSPAPSRTPARTPARPPAGGLPLGVDPGSSSQVVTVVAASAGATTAKLTAWQQRGTDGWTPVLGPVTARVGAAGIGRASESTTRTPAGTFTLTEAFGRSGDPGTALPYRVVDGDDWWVSDVNSPRYNQYVQCAPGTCAFDEAAGENLFAAGLVYAQAVVIDYNRAGTPGSGSAYFLHVTNGRPTAGCVAIDAGSLVTLMRWLDPGARPLISIGVG